MKSQAIAHPKVLVILGPTASGKSELAVNMAKWIMRHGNSAEVISADSRQVYRGLNLGSGKVPGKWYADMRSAIRDKRYAYKGITHHMLDVANPKRQYSVAEYQKSARKIVYALLVSGYTPIVCGGTAQYIDALLYDYPIPEVKPNRALRARLEKKSVEELFAELARLDSARAKTIDRHNPRRLIRALEIIYATGALVPLSPLKHVHSYFPIRANWKVVVTPKIIKVGLCPPDETLKARIAKRLRTRLKAGMVAEVERLHKKGLSAGRSLGGGLSWKRLDGFGLEYRFVSRYLRGMLTKEQMMEAIKKESWRYVKRQMTWWKRDKEIRWVKNGREALAVVKKFLTGSPPSPARMTEVIQSGGREWQY